ncbi:hypothetical protein CS542_09850 [Pedobacter sp. IW39]|nr:hypothetical protein CS542_09850 [Pedobacter sp. IW39]
MLYLEPITGLIKPELAACYKGFNICDDHFYSLLLCCLNYYLKENYQYPAFAVVAYIIYGA